MPEPVQRPATDEQLRSLADRAVARWIDDADQALRDRWAARPIDPAKLAGIPSEERRRWWADQVRDYAQRRIGRWREAARQGRIDVAAQVFAQLLTLDPRPGEQDAARQTPELQRKSGDLLIATAAARPLVDEARAIDVTVAELVGRAPVLDDLRAAKAAEATLRGREMTPLVAEGGDDGIGEDGSLKRMLLEPHLQRRDALRDRVPDARRIGLASDRALTRAFDAPLLDQCRVVAGEFNTARAALAVVVEAELPGIQAAIDKAARAFDDRFADPYTLARAVRQVEFYGRAALLALCGLPPDIVTRALLALENTARQSEFRTDWPQGTTQDALERAFARVAYERAEGDGKGGYPRQDRASSAQ